MGCPPGLRDDKEGRKNKRRISEESSEEESSLGESSLGESSVEDYSEEVSNKVQCQ